MTTATREPARAETLAADAAALLQSAAHMLESQSAEKIPEHDDAYTLVAEARELVTVTRPHACDGERAAALCRAALVFVEVHMPTWGGPACEERVCRTLLRMAEPRLRELADVLDAAGVN